MTSDAARATAERQVSAHRPGLALSRLLRPAARRSFLNYQIAKVVDLTDHPVPSGWTNPSSTQLPVTPTGGAFDPLALFSARYSAAYGFPDPMDADRATCRCASCSSRA